MTIHHVAFAKGQEFILIQKPVLPVADHGSQDGEGITTVHITTPISNGADWIVQNYWDGTNIVSRGNPPNEYATWDASTTSWTTPAGALMAEVRNRRNKKLTASDWTQMPDNGLTDAQVTEARTYRTALRNVPANNTSITNVSEVNWPTKPSFM